MDAQAVEQAKAKLRKAEKSLEMLKDATNYDEAEESWSDFLLAASTIYSKLEQGAKRNGKSSGWYGRKKKERKDDPLLRYIHFARNSDEHGIERVVGQTSPNPTNTPLKFNERRPMRFQILDEETKQPSEWREGVIAGSTIQPVRAHDRRFNDYCDPPKTHRGKDIKFGGQFCYEIGIAAVSYLSELIEEARELIPAPPNASPSKSS